MLGEVFFRYAPLASAIVLCTLGYILSNLFFSGSKPTGTPWGPCGKTGVRAALQSAIQTVLDVRKTLVLSGRLPAAESHGFIFSTMLDGAITALPMRNLKWLASLPEDVASFYDAQEDRIELRYTIPAATLSDPAVTKRLVKILTRRTKSMVPDLYNEIQHLCQQGVYTKSQWQPLCLYPEMVRILAATSNRMLVGKPLCKC